ncbi:MAG TPA: LysR substrate-binding domain-containing protein [Polyangiales bacterium]|nr:LysR substrate-binding domain-containing protein [Polyangiales bacterium]
MSTGVEAARLGHGFGWYPETRIRAELAAGQLKQLPMRDVDDRFVELYLVFSQRETAGPAVQRLAELLRRHVSSGCQAELSDLHGAGNRD